MAENECTVVKFKGYLKFVDLGLPSGTKWATMNVGATTPYEAGDFFSWGNVIGHAGDSGYNFSQANYEVSAGATLTDDIPANASYDAAKAHYSNLAKMPTIEQFQELISNCTSEWVTINGVNGRKLTSNVNGNSIFLPACGYCNGTELLTPNAYGHYWSCSYRSPSNAMYLQLYSGNINASKNAEKYLGFSVRAVI